MISVFNPMAAMAITIKNLDRVLKGRKKEASSPTMVPRVVIRDASTKNRMKKGTEEHEKDIAD